MQHGIGSTAIVIGLAGILALGGCAVVPPSSPTVMALPGPGKTFQQFQQEDYSCRAYAQQHTGYAQPGVGPAVTGAGLGALAGAAGGAAIGAIAGNAGAGAAIGGVTGLLGGGAIGANNAAGQEASLQQRYNVAYTQCMYSHGNTVQSPPPAYGAVAAPTYAYAYPAYPAYPAYAAPGLSFGFGFGGGGWGHRHWHRW